MEYKDTLNLPATDFPMKANLAQREPELVAWWDETKTYSELLEKNKGKPLFVLHDGPPYANGHIHFGHILNKVLKDIVVKYRNMSGSCTHFVPGWDCHGLPIELQVEKEMGKKGTHSKVDIRKACREYAMKFVDQQRKEFKRIGVLGEWEKPYLTMNYPYESTIAHEFGKFVKEGYVYKGKKPIYWCASCRTALAEAEVEYQDHTAPSIYVKFKLKDDADLRSKHALGDKPIYMVIWTTTPWTIPANLGICLHPEFEYSAIDVGEEIWILATGLVETMLPGVGITLFDNKATIASAELEKRKCRHPLIDRDSLVILGDHVTLEAGTGCVHTAPGHGQEDYEVGLKYGLEVLAPIDNAGRFTKECQIPWLEGVFVEDANKPIIEKLTEVCALVKSENVAHSYPHCWRCKKPIVFRSTEQWFISMLHNNFRAEALKAIDTVEWIPHWGRDRIFGMMENRPDWCISRQRVWGVPIIAVRCKGCETSSTTYELVKHVSDRFEAEGSDIWFSEPLEKLIPAGYKCPKCGGTAFEKEEDILDVWFESGVSFAAVCEKTEGLRVPADLYLEGSDQHRGWFHSSLLASIGTRKVPPYKAVLTHGFVVDAEGKKYSKSAKNYVPPDEVLKTSGAEILRLWVAAEDYRNDIRVSNEIIKRLVESYRKIRNTCRYMLGNLNDFAPDKDAVSFDKLQELDKWALHRLQKLIARCREAYEKYEFHVIYHELNRFCTVDLSSFYLDILKDRLYCEKKDGVLRRSAQTAMWEILSGITKLMAPILSFLAEDVWKYIADHDGKPHSVFLTEMPKVNEAWLDEKLAGRWDRFEEVRSEVSKVIEQARKDKVVGNSLESKVVLEIQGELKDFLASFGPALADLFIVSDVEFGPAKSDHVYASEEMQGLKIAVMTADGGKCSRCWKYSTTVGSNADHPEICDRCRGVVA